MNQSKEILVIIDPQNDFTHDKGIYSKRHNGITQIKSALRNINSTIKNISGIPKVVVYSDYEENQFEDNLSICIPGTFGHKINLDLSYVDFIFKKNIHSVFSSLEFINFLETSKINTIYFCGFLAEYCIQSSILDSTARDLKLIIVEDCIGTGDDVQERKINLLNNMKNQGISIFSSKDLILKDKEVKSKAYGV